METAEGWENKTSGRSESSWFREAPALEFQPLGKDAKADIAVIGGGIAGMTCAYLLWSSLAYTGAGALVGVGVLAAGGALLMYLRPSDASPPEDSP